MSARPVYITRVAAFLPNDPVGNDDMERILGQVGERPSRARRLILRSNGIRTRYYAIDPTTLSPTHTNASLTAEAIRRVAGNGFDLDSLECLACGTSMGDQIMPNHAAMVHGELQLHSLDLVATAGICLSGLTALRYAQLNVATGDRANAIASGSELSSALLAAHNYGSQFEQNAALLEEQPELAFEQDFLRWMLSDGAGAVLIEPQPRANALNLRIDWIELFSYAGELPACMYAGAVKNETGTLQGWARMSPHERNERGAMTLKQDVKLLNENIVHFAAERPLRALMAKRHLRASDYQYFLPHYSSHFFRDRLYAGLRTIGFDLPQERWFTNLSTRGNTGAASIYLMLEELASSGRLRSGERLLCFVPESGRFSAGFMSLTVM
ncbi:MAG TPA: beta-ketoacyl-ACP synthase III [Steroidobacteraceae bacterium]|nr:beta-ketoacyl-ACP synthase III [Steroidobacteraceae bacterium]